MEVTILREHDAGCYLDSHRGHYITRDMIQLAVEYGFIIGTFDAYALAHYDDWADWPYPEIYEALHDLADEALAWLNCGDNSGIDRPIKGQNSPPKIPDGYAWDWNDGDFGLYPIEED